jgi:DNA-binding transcriptional regulator YiaG
MSTKPKTVKAPKLFLNSGKEAVVLRKKLSLNQSDFWRKIAVTQSGGSRYESGRNIPRQVQILLHLVYAPEAQALTMFNFLRFVKE